VFIILRVVACVVTDADLEADAARFEDGECIGEWRIV
jgi:putative 2-hydroxy-3-oxopropionate reductase